MDSNKHSNRISRLLEEVSTPESSDNNEDPYHDDGGEYDSDKDYRPSAESDSSDDEIGFNGISARHRRRYNSSSSSDNNAPVSPPQQYPALQSEQPVAQGASDLLQPTDLDLSFQSPEIEQPGAQPANDNFHDMDIFVPSPEATDSEQLQNNEEWSQTTIPIADFHFEESSSGPRFDVNSIQTPLDMFKLVFPENLIDHIVECTNKYGERLTGQGGPRTRNSRHYKFRPVDRQEILSVFGICLLQGQLKFPLRRYFFSNDPLYYHPFFQHVTSGRRFEQVIRCLCVADDQAKGEHKVLDFIKALNNNFQLIYGPSKELSIDESLILFRGRVIFRQYIKSKKARYGIKFYVLTTASGYVLDMIMYRGKDASAETGKKTQNIVLKLLEPYVLKGHHVFMDNFYNSVELSQKLLDLRTHSCGTLRKNRKGNPRVLTSLKLKKGDYYWYRKGQIYVSMWRDKRPVYTISTRDHPKLEQVPNRHGKLGTKPAEVAAYNTFMGGVDRVDQMTSYYSSPRKSIRWYKRVIFHCLDIAVWNAFYLYKTYVKKNQKYKSIEFRDQLIKEMCQISGDIKGSDVVRKDSVYSSRRFRQNVAEECSVAVMKGHWPVVMLPPTSDGNKRKFKYLNCKLCTKVNKRKETKYICKGCVKRTPLCPECFEDWHILHGHIQQDANNRED